MKLLPKWWRKHFLVVELVLSITLTAAFALWCIRFGGARQIDTLLKDNRASIFGTLASICGSLLGFVITVTSIVIGFQASDRMKFLRESKHYTTLWKIFLSTNWALALATLFSLLCLVFDRGPGITAFCYLLAFSLLFSAFRLLRSLWALENVLRLITSTPSSSSPEPPP